MAFSFRKQPPVVEASDLQPVFSSVSARSVSLVDAARERRSGGGECKGMDAPVAVAVAAGPPPPPPPPAASVLTVPAAAATGWSRASGLPVRQLKAILSCLRRFARTVWSENLALADGFEEKARFLELCLLYLDDLDDDLALDGQVVAALSERYPDGMLYEMGGFMQAFLQDVLASIPPDGSRAATWTVNSVPEANLKSYEASLLKMLKVSGRYEWPPGLPRKFQNGIC